MEGVGFGGGDTGSTSAHDEPTVVEEAWLTSQTGFNKGGPLKHVVGCQSKLGDNRHEFFYGECDWTDVRSTSMSSGESRKMTVSDDEFTCSSIIFC